MRQELIDCVHTPGELVHLLSADEGTLFWAAGMRQELQTCLDQAEVDREYVGHCLALLLRSGGWRQLKNDKALPFPSFIRFCCDARPHGLNLSRAALATFLAD